MSTYVSIGVATPPLSGPSSPNALSPTRFPRHTFSFTRRLNLHTRLLFLAAFLASGTLLTYAILIGRLELLSLPLQEVVAEVPLHRVVGGEVPTVHRVVHVEFPVQEAVVEVPAVVGLPLQQVAEEVPLITTLRHQFMSYVWREGRSAGKDGEQVTATAGSIDGDYVMIIPVNSGMLTMAYNLLCSLRRVKSEAKPVIWALDDKAVEELQAYRRRHQYDFGIYHDPGLFAVSSFEKGGTKNYWRMMKERPVFFLALLREARLNVLFVDADIVFYSDPWDIVRQSNGADLAISTDARDFYDRLKTPYEGKPLVPKICAGLFAVRSNPRTIHLYEVMADMLKSNRRYNDQSALDAILNSQDIFNTTLVLPIPYGLGPPPKPATNSTVPNLKVQILSQNTYVNGAIYIKHRNGEYVTRVVKDGGHRVAVHGNWWYRDKFKDFKDFGLWFLNDKNECLL